MDTFSKTGDGEAPEEGRFPVREEQAKIPILEERLVVGTRKVEAGSVQIHKKVVTEQVEQQIALTHEEVQIERVAIGRYIEAAPALRYEGNVTIISVVKEVLVVEKRLVLVEELHLTKKQVLTTAIVKDTLRKEEIEVGRTGSAQEGIKPTDQ